MVSTSFPRDDRDWQGRFIHDMTRHLAARQGVDLALWAPPGDLPDRVACAATRAESEWLRGMSRRGGIAQILRRGKLKGLATAAHLMAKQWCAYRRVRADLVHVNWLQNALALGRTSTPALVTALGSDLGLLRLPGMRAALRAVLSGRRAVIAPNAEWMVGPLRAALGDAAAVNVVPFGVAAEWFDVKRRSAAAESRDWLVVSRVTAPKIGDLLTWGDGLFGSGRQLHLFGPLQDRLSLPAWVRYHGTTHPAALRAEWFPRVSGLVTLSRHDEGRPQVMLEAMASGVPVVASDQAAHRDFVRHGQTGFIVRGRQDFEAAVVRLEEGHENRCVGEQARAWIRDSVGTWDDCARRYAALYDELIAA